MTNRPGRSASAIILAGGLATRMGGEKPLRRLHGTTLLDLALDLARTACDDLIVACGARLFSVPTGVRLAPDADADHGKGPLAGVRAGLALARHERVLVLACDLPNITPPLAAALLGHLPAHGCVWCRHGADEPLVAALLREPAAVAVDQALAQGRNKVLPVWQALNPLVITGEALAAFGDPAKLFANINTPADLSAQENGPA